MRELALMTLQGGASEITPEVSSQRELVRVTVPLILATISASQNGHASRSFTGLYKLGPRVVGFKAWEIISSIVDPAVMRRGWKESQTIICQT